jgi:hypothetical protein
MDSHRFSLQGHQIQRLAAPVGVRTESGLLWITVDGEREDILLAPGESRCFERDAPVVVYALGGEARFTVASARVRRSARAERWGHRLASWLRGARPALGGGT